MTGRTDIDVKALAARLRKLRNDLVKEGERSAESRQPVEVDPARTGRLGRLEDIQAQELALDAERRRITEIRRIDAALERVASGEYGFCLSCGIEIPLRRLQTDPAVPMCVDCATKKQPRSQ